MFRLLLVSLCCLSAISCAAEPPKAVWEKYVVPGHYESDYPAQVIESTESLPTGIGKIDIYVAEASLGENEFTCMRVTYNVKEDEFDIELGMDGGVEGAMEKFKDAKLLSNSKEPYQGFPAREFTFSGGYRGVNILIHQRLVGVGTSMYQQIFVTTASEGLGSKDEKRFFDSLKILAEGK